jgi:hypothetical protein
MRLKADTERLRDEVSQLREQVEQQSRELRTQFTRIAEMQAILDGERLSNGKDTRAPSLAPAHPEH